MNNRYASDIVSHQNPLMLPPTTTVKQACQRMRDRRVGAVPITEGDRRLVGIFTGRDAVGRVLAEGITLITLVLLYGAFALVDGVFTLLAIEAAGARLLYLPRYSPDLDPIEQAFAKLKAFLRKAAERSVRGLSH
jgi:hypothetical protein